MIYFSSISYYYSTLTDKVKTYHDITCEAKIDWAINIKGYSKERHKH
jgi:hypothetical protein